MIPAFYFWTCVLGLSIGTFLIRYSMIGLSARVKIPARTRELFSFIPAAILPAFLVPVVFFHQGKVEWLHGKERLFVAVLAAVVAFWTRSTLAVIAFGLALLYALTQF
ncbi:MAG: AzlD domain-containing protein [Bdellovibrionaceae bacterium]|nr:AzlD domain-containing protein [Pseudobdellovibrionaceae bacterium]